LTGHRVPLFGIIEKLLFQTSDASDSSQSAAAISLGPVEY